MTFPLLSHLYAFQILEYDLDRFWRWITTHPLFFPPEIKSKLVWSPKARLLFILSLLLQTILAATAAKLSSAGSVFLALTAVLSLFPFLLITVAAFLLKPLEWLETEWLVGRARAHLRARSELVVIGITGSFGKTSVKEILKELLLTKYNLVATPESHNKKLSVARAVLQKVNPQTQILIVEMGAYHQGEIRDLCKLVKPTIGILTGITSQHLERFGSLNSIKAAKNELVESLPSYGQAVFNLDNPGSRELFGKCQLLNKRGYSLTASVKDPLIEVSEKGTTFDLFGQKVTTPLLGQHNVLNLLAAVSVAEQLGIEKSQLLQSIISLKPIPHRLEPLTLQSGALVLDDAYSGNIEGYKAAFEFVKNLGHYPKILVTPGLVELGPEQFLENKKMAKDASHIFDFIVVVNLTNRPAFLSGFKETSWQSCPVDQTPSTKDRCFFFVDSLTQASAAILPKITKPNSLILFENDLPDIYG